MSILQPILNAFHWILSLKVGDLQCRFIFQSKYPIKWLHNSYVNGKLVEIVWLCAVLYCHNSFFMYSTITIANCNAGWRSDGDGDDKHPAQTAALLPSLLLARTLHFVFAHHFQFSIICNSFRMFCVCNVKTITWRNIVLLSMSMEKYLILVTFCLQSVLLPQLTLTVMLWIASKPISNINWRCCPLNPDSTRWIYLFTFNLGGYTKPPTFDP